MEKREIIEQTIKNMELVYYDVSQIGQLVEEKLKKEGFEPLGDTGFTWETSTALGRPDSWLYKYFARAYVNGERPKFSVGFCIHLMTVDQNQLKKLTKFSISLPVISISLLKMEAEVKKLWRPDVFNLLWFAGYDDSYLAFQNILDRRIVFATVSDKELKGGLVTYFVDLLSLTNGDLIQHLVADPMVKMFTGKEDWVVKEGLKVVEYPDEVCSTK